jgi:hypothetical protein
MELDGRPTGHDATTCDGSFLRTSAIRSSDISALHHIYASVFRAWMVPRFPAAQLRGVGPLVYRCDDTPILLTLPCHVLPHAPKQA